MNKIQTSTIQIKKASSMMCFAILVGLVTSDPAPDAQNKLQIQFNCENCDSHKYCCQLADTLA